jgi:hypothetical protein
MDGDRVFPLYHVFADLAECPGADVLPVRSPQPLLVEALGLSRGKQQCILIANLSGEPQRVRLPTQFPSAKIRLLDRRHVGEATASPETYRTRCQEQSIGGGCLTLDLAPYAVARVDLR